MGRPRFYETDEGPVVLNVGQMSDSRLELYERRQAAGIARSKDAFAGAVRGGESSTASSPRGRGPSEDGFELSFECRANLEEVGNNAVRGMFEDRRFGILVDGDNDL